MFSSPELQPLSYRLQLPNRITLLMYTVASPDPDANPRGGGQLPDPNECNSTLTSGTNNIDDRGQHLRITHTRRQLH